MRDKLERYGKPILTGVLWIAVLVIGMQVMGWLRAPSLPDRAPEFSLPDLEGKPVALSDFRGQTVVLNFWATWCGPCRIEAPEFSKFASANPDIAVLGIAADGPAAKLKVESRRIGITYPVLQGDNATLAAYDVSVFPTTVVVSPEGEVRQAHAGMLFRPQLSWMTR